MAKSLAELVKTIDRFEHTDKYFTAEQQRLLRRKEVYPYDYMMDFSKFAETELPQKEALDSWLKSAGTVSCSNEFDGMKPKEISNKNYEHAQKVFKDFACKNLGDFTELYCNIRELKICNAAARRRTFKTKNIFIEDNTYE